MDEQMRTGTQLPPTKGCRIGLEEIPGDWLTVAEFARWSGLSRNAAYELLRQDPLRKHVERFGRMIRIRKAALMRLMRGAS